MDASLTALTPWVAYAVSERVSVWGAFGYGTGDFTLTPEGEDDQKTDIDMKLAAAGARGTLMDGDGPRLDAVSDARWVWTTSERVSSNNSNLESSEAEVTLLRLGLQGSWQLQLASGAELTPSVEIGLRHDGGDAETGFGADTGAGLAWIDPERGLKAEIRARGLLSHEDGSFRESSFAGSLTWDQKPSSTLGWSLTLSQIMGASATGGIDALLQPTTANRLAANDNGDDLRSQRLEASLGYGFPLAGGQYVGIPEVGVNFSNTDRKYSFSWRVGHVVFSP